MKVQKNDMKSWLRVLSAIRADRTPWVWQHTGTFLQLFGWRWDYKRHRLFFLAKRAHNVFWSLICTVCLGVTTFDEGWGGMGESELLFLLSV